MASAASNDFQRDAHGKRVILMVEDEVIIRSVVAEHLRDVNFTVIEAANAAEAIAVLSSQTHVDLVFSDITMPGELDGVGLARWIADRRGEIPVLMTSGAAVLDWSGPFSRLPFVRKPYGLEDIEERIRKLLAQYSQ